MNKRTETKPKSVGKKKKTPLMKKTDLDKKSLEPLIIGGQEIPMGETHTIYLNLARLYDFTELTMPVRIIRGKKPGPTIFVSASIHGDEVIGGEIIRRIIADKRLKHLSGTLILIPVVNVFGYNTMSRYLPDRRDLNRSFPGSPDGSLAGRVAHIFQKEILEKSDIGIDLHSATNQRRNLPQVRASLEDPETKKLALSFGAPVVIDSKLRDGSLRESARQMGVKMLVFEGGESLRVHETVVRSGVIGVFSVMREAGMLPADLVKPHVHLKPIVAKSSFWLRAEQSGVLRPRKNLGSAVRIGDRVATVTDVFGEQKIFLYAKAAGVIIGQNRLPQVSKGDPVYHIATFQDQAEIDRLTGNIPEILAMAQPGENLV